MNIPENLFYTKEHEWAKIDGNTAAIGITDHAQHALGDITFVEVPQLKKTIKQFGPCAAVESVKAASDVYAPVSGEVTEVNSALAEHPELVNQSPYEKGWIAKIALSNPDEKQQLMNAQQYRDYLEKL